MSFYEEYARQYEEKTKDATGQLGSLERFCSLLEEGSTILDVGCAYGRDCAVFQEKGFEVMGIDPSQSLIARAKELVPGAEFYEKGIEDLPDTKWKVDALWCNAVLLHFPKVDVSKAITDILSVVVDGGYVFFAVRAGETEGVIQDERFGGAERYFAYYQLDEFVSLLEGVGLEIVHAEQRGAKKYDNTEMIEVIAQKPSL